MAVLWSQRSKKSLIRNLKRRYLIKKPYQGSKKYILCHKTLPYQESKKRYFVIKSYLIKKPYQESSKILTKKPIKNLKKGALSKNLIKNQKKVPY